MNIDPLARPNAGPAFADRRQFILGACSAAFIAAGPEALAVSRPRSGAVMAIGGAERHGGRSEVLRRFLGLCGGGGKRLVVCTAASADPERVWQAYSAEFKRVGALDCAWVDARSRQQAGDPTSAGLLANAEGIFLTGGDQSRLVDSLADSDFAHAISVARTQRGACLAGTSAGAAALSKLMLASGAATLTPEKDAVQFSPGLGFVPHAVIDQHFAERHRLGRLMSAVAEYPTLLGVGIDEDTALIVEEGRGIEVVGSGTVTLLDGRRVRSDFKDAASNDTLTMLGLRMHVLTRDSLHRKSGRSLGVDNLPASLLSAIDLLVSR